MTEEYLTRLEDIQTGPWREKSELARERMPTLSTIELERYLRPHFGDAITDRDELRFRESFDQILEELQLLELAVACGFLPLDLVGQAVEHDFSLLFSSEAARGYIKQYDFVPVRFLASRLGIDLKIGPVNPPPIQPRAEVRYAVFLATHYDFASSGPIELFTMFIDDFHFGSINDRFLINWIRGDQPSDLSHRGLELVSGAYMGFLQFTQTLGDFFFQLPESVRPYFGLAYSYWLSHYFGLRRRGDRYVKRHASFGDVRFPPSLAASATSIDVANAELKSFQDRIKTLSAVWDSTHQLIDAHRL